MIARARAWFADRSQREQWAVAAAAILFAITLIWLGFIRPISDGLSSARERHDGAVLRLAETGTQMKELDRLQRNRPSALSAPLDAEIRTRAGEAGFELSSVSTQPDNAVQIIISSARPQAFFAWIADLEASGIIVSALSTNDNGNQTISATVSLKARGV